MNQEIQKNLERARRSLEKNKLREAVSAFQAVLAEEPDHPEALQALADIYTRLNEPALAAQYYGVQFDKHVDAGDSAKASAIFTRFLRPHPQPPDRLMRYAALLQRQNRTPEAIEQYGKATDLFLRQSCDIEALACCESVALLDPENAARHVALGELAERLHHADLAARSFLRAGELTLASGSLDDALDYFGRAHNLSPGDRSITLPFAAARLRNGDGHGAVALLEPFWPGASDTAFLELFGQALLRAGQLDRAREILEACHKQKPESFEQLFELAAAYLRAGENEEAASVLADTKESMRRARKESELASRMDSLVTEFPASLPLAQMVARSYEEMNRESKYFDSLVRLFDLYLGAGRIKEACDTLDRLVDIDPYDIRNQQRIAALEGKVDPAFHQNILARAAKAATVTTRTEGFSGAGSGDIAAVSEESRDQQALEDLIVQVEIFLQYSLHAKAVERLERIAELYPGEEEKNERLRALCERADWRPERVAASSAKPQPAAAATPAAPHAEAHAPVAAPTAAETHRDLAAIAEINRLTYRQATPRDVLATMAAKIGEHIGAARCLAIVGAAGDPAQMTAEYFASGMKAVDASRIPSIAELVSNAKPDELGGIELNASATRALRDFGLVSALGVVLTDKEKQAPCGALIVGDASMRKWKPNESFFLQAAGDQLVLAVNHTRMRSLARSLDVTDEKTGLLSRGAYIDCLLAETKRARAQSRPLSLVLLQIDRGSTVLDQRGDSAVEDYMEQLARALSSAIRHTDIAVKYTAWSLVFVLPDTPLSNATALADNLREVAATVKPSWNGAGLTLSAVVAEASARQGDDTEDRVTEWINRAEAGLDAAQQRGGNVLLPLATP